MDGVLELLVKTWKLMDAPSNLAFEGCGSAPIPSIGISMRALDVPEMKSVSSSA
ncbi:MAG: Uncharacterised protein [Marine Group II euryarchaeote MED-G33]|nr:MAG: Uncharacterised protein [Marine Group II euryarchaeote MED-G33]